MLQNDTGIWALKNAVTSGLWSSLDSFLWISMLCRKNFKHDVIGIFFWKTNISVQKEIFLNCLVLLIFYHDAHQSLFPIISRSQRLILLDAKNNTTNMFIPHKLLFIQDHKIHLFPTKIFFDFKATLVNAFTQQWDIFKEPSFLYSFFLLLFPPYCFFVVLWSYLKRKKGATGRHYIIKCICILNGKKTGTHETTRKKVKSRRKIRFLFLDISKNLILGI